METRCRMGRTQNRPFRPKMEASNLVHNICSSNPSPPRAAGMLPSWGWVGGPTDDQEYPILCLSLPPPHSSEYYWKYSQQAGGARAEGTPERGRGSIKGPPSPRNDPPISVFPPLKPGYRSPPSLPPPRSCLNRFSFSSSPNTLFFHSFFGGMLWKVFSLASEVLF